MTNNEEIKPLMTDNTIYRLCLLGLFLSGAEVIDLTQLLQFQKSTKMFLFMSTGASGNDDFPSI